MLSSSSSSLRGRSPLPRNRSNNKQLLQCTRGFCNNPIITALLLAQWMTESLSKEIQQLKTSTRDTTLKVTYAETEIVTRLILTLFLPNKCFHTKTHKLIYDRFSTEFAHLQLISEFILINFNKTTLSKPLKCVLLSRGFPYIVVPVPWRLKKKRSAQLRIYCEEVQLQNSFDNPRVDSNDMPRRHILGTSRKVGR